MDYGRPVQFGYFILPDSMAAKLTANEAVELALEYGFDTFVVGGMQEDAEAELREFLENVAPKVRDLVAKARESS